jgi:hypothetical protein
MRLLQTLLRCEHETNGWTDLTGDLQPAEASLVLAFGLRAHVAAPMLIDRLRARFPQAQCVVVSTAGNFADIQIEDESVVCTALRFSHASSQAASASLADFPDQTALCRHLVSQLAKPGLRHVLVFSDGARINGTTLSSAFNTFLPKDVTLSGGLAGDGTDFALTLVGLDAAPAPGVVVAIGLYGDSLRIGFGSAGGWRAFGPSRKVTAAHGNVLESLDGQPALAIYRTYLGPEAGGLPAAALRFPLHVQAGETEHGVVRTILSIDEAAQTMTFAGDLPVGATVRFMHASYEDLVGGAENAARASHQEASLVLCVSCVGRRIVLGQHTEDELESVRAVFGAGPVLTGFHSYGELAPSGAGHACQLHNQTMTITSLAEDAA